MSGNTLPDCKIGWMGAGRMGAAMVRRLAEAGADITVYNRSIEKAETLKRYGVGVARSVTELGRCEMVFTMLSTEDVLQEALLGEGGLLSGAARPRILVDCSSISPEASQTLRKSLEAMKIAFLAAPVSGNPQVVARGNAGFAASGARGTFAEVAPFLLAMGVAATYVGEGELARVAKICHNLWLGVLTQGLAEATVLAQKAGMTRKAFLDFLNSSALASTYTHAKTPDWVTLDFTPAFTPALMRKDMDLALSLARRLGATLPLGSATREMFQSLLNLGYEDADFSALLILQASASGVLMTPESMHHQPAAGVED